MNLEKDLTKTRQMIALIPDTPSLNSKLINLEFINKTAITFCGESFSQSNLFIQKWNGNTPAEPRKKNLPTGMNSCAHGAIALHR